MRSKILIGLTGSIACYKTAHVISQLTKIGHEVQVVATSSALNFIGEATLEGLSHRPVLSDNFTRGHMMDHISLARWADVFVVAPLSASHINKFALGASDDLLSTIYLAYEQSKPLLVAPAMNATMYSHPSVQKNLELIRTWGAQVIEPQSGILACGEDGLGKMAEPEEILRVIEKQLNRKTSETTVTRQPKTTAKPKRLLVTYGGTQESIDGVRSITNFSTGRTGNELINWLTKQGHEVYALAGAQALKPSTVHQFQTFTTYQDLATKVYSLLNTKFFDAVLHLAAVSDFSVDRIVMGARELTPSQDLKLSSDESIILKLKTNAKIVNTLKASSKNSNVQVFAFKLTKTLSKVERQTAALKLLHSTGVDYVVLNDLNEISIEKNLHPFVLFSHRGSPMSIQSVEELAMALDKILAAANRAEAKHDLMS